LHLAGVIVEAVNGTSVVRIIELDSVRLLPSPDGVNLEAADPNFAGNPVRFW